MEKEIEYKTVDKLSGDLKVGDAFRVGDLLAEIVAIRTNDKDQRVLDLVIVGSKYKKHSTAMLIISKKLPFQIETSEIVE